MSNFLLLAACGNIGDPLPPLIQIPNAVSDLTATQFGKHVILSWTLPKLNTDRSEATTLARLEIYRLVGAANALPPDKDRFSQSATRLMVIDQRNFAAYREEDKLIVTDRLQGLNDRQILQNEFIYAIKAVNDKKQDAGFSNLASLKIFSVPQPPGGLQTSYTEDFIELRWEHPTRNFDGSPVIEEVKYDVYRSEMADAAVKHLLNRMPIPDTFFRDESMVLWKSYYYVIRAVIRTPAGLIESFDSQKLGATNIDVYPPKAPSEVTAISDGQSISLVWLPNTELDLAGYQVYRSEERQGYKRLTEQIITTASYMDKSVEKGKIYYYRIEAVDIHGNPSGYSEEVRDEVE